MYVRIIEKYNDIFLSKVPIMPSCFKLLIVIFSSNIHHFAYIKDSKLRREKMGGKGEKELGRERKRRKDILVQEKIQKNMNFSTIM